MAAVQVGVVIVLLRLARRVDVLATRVETELGPLAERLLAVAGNLQQASSLAAVQVEFIVHRLLPFRARLAVFMVLLFQWAVYWGFIALIEVRCVQRLCSHRAGP